MELSKYLQLCKEYRAEPEEYIVEQLKEISDHPTDPPTLICLNLSNNNLSVKSCLALAKFLEHDRYITELKFTDCMLPEDGLKTLLLSLTSNSVVQSLNLKGNNIRGNGSRVLGKLLKKNSVLKNLTLEWNALGLDQEAFSVFAYGLRVNISLLALDLRSNQISHDCMEHLSSALARNTSLLYLDIQWNNVGLLGGRKILESLQFNQKICKMDLAGNSIPFDILSAIDTCLVRNKESLRVIREHSTQTQVLTDGLKKLQMQSKLETVALLEKLNEQAEDFTKTNTFNNVKIGKLKFALDSARKNYTIVVSKLQIAEQDAISNQQKVEDLTEMIVELRKKNEHITTNYEHNLLKQSEQYQSCEKKFALDMNSVKEKKTELEVRVAELESKCRTQQQQIFELKEEITILQAELKIKETETGELMEVEKQKFKECLKEFEEAKRKEMTKLHSEFAVHEKNLRDKVHLKEQDYLQHQEELNNFKAEMLQEKLRNEEKLMEIKLKTREDEHKKVKALEEKMLHLEIDKSDLQRQLAQQSLTSEDLEKKNKKSAMEIMSLKHKFDDLHQESSKKEKEFSDHISKLQQQLKEQHSIYQQETFHQQELQNKIKTLERNLSDQASKFEKDLEIKNHKISTLQEHLRHKEDEILDMREDERNRVAMLQSAFVTYSKPFLRTSSRPH